MTKEKKYVRILAIGKERVFIAFTKYYEFLEKYF